MQEMLKITGIRKSFSTLDVLKGVDLTVHKGEVVSLIGPSGSGKTTLLRCANFLDQAEDGTMVLDGQTYHLGHVRRTEMYEARRHTAFVLNLSEFPLVTSAQSLPIRSKTLSLMSDGLIFLKSDINILLKFCSCFKIDESRFLFYYFVPVEPKPPSPRSVSESSLTSVTVGTITGAITICATLSNGSTV